MASPVKHAQRAHKSSYKIRTNRNWFWNRQAYKVWLDTQRKFNKLTTFTSTPAETAPEAEVVED
jgi:hypothetical protein